MERLYSVSHQWVVIEGDSARVGISDHAQDSLGDIVFADLPKTGKSVTMGDEAAVIESMKAASPVEAPLSGTISEINAVLVKRPELINADPLGAGWMFVISGIDREELSHLMTEPAYLEFIENQQ